MGHCIAAVLFPYAFQTGINVSWFRRIVLLRGEGFTDLMVESEMLAGGRQGSLAPAFLQSEGKEAAACRWWESLLYQVDFIKGFTNCHVIAC